MDEAEGRCVPASRGPSANAAPSSAAATSSASLRSPSGEASSSRRWEHLDRAGELFSRYGAKLHLDQVLVKRQILKA